MENLHDDEILFKLKQLSNKTFAGDVQFSILLLKFTASDSFRMTKKGN
jgi:hypothetical protein